jgi:hypothetical protein
MDMMNTIEIENNNTCNCVGECTCGSDTNSSTRATAALVYDRPVIKELFGFAGIEYSPDSKVVCDFEQNYKKVSSKILHTDYLSDEGWDYRSLITEFVDLIEQMKYYDLSSPKDHDDRPVNCGVILSLKEWLLNPKDNVGYYPFFNDPELLESMNPEELEKFDLRRREDIFQMLMKDYISEQRPSTNEYSKQCSDFITKIINLSHHN